MPEQPVPIAIVGVSCRFPGGAYDLDSLWKGLVEGRTAWSDVPSSRYNWRSFHHPSRGSNAAHTHRGGHFLNQDVTKFDAGFFGVSPEEAKAIDPQHRIQLEIAYEALENAGISLEKIKGSNTGVFVAIFNHDYENMIYKDATAPPKYSMTGIGQAIASNRISYNFDLQGPSLTLDTGCSGSLVALHLACQSLKSGESNMALVGGTNLILNPDTMIPMDLLHLLNADGKCYSFDNRGGGYGRGEGVAMVVLKRLEDAVQADDPLRGIIRNSAVGQDGKTSGITMPSGDAQQRLIAAAYRSVSLEPSETGYVEAHGTGTIAGDLAEMAALENVFCEDRVNPLYVGSIKANIGHLESTSGLAGLIKTVLILEKGLIPSTPSLEVLKGRLQSLSSHIEIPQKVEYWPSSMVRRASVNSFGYGGTNAHVIVDGVQAWRTNPDSYQKNTSNQGVPGSRRTGTNRVEAQSSYRIPDGNLVAPHVQVQPGKERFWLFVVTAKSEWSCMAALKSLLEWAKSRNDSDYIEDLAYTLTSRRSLMPWRYTIAASNKQTLLASLASTTQGAVRTTNVNRVIYVFTGQGSQWFAMARELLNYPRFKECILGSGAILKRLGASWSLLEELVRNKATSRVGESKVGMPATTAIQIGLVGLLRNLGVNPDAVLGHSSGEIAAAYTAGALSKHSAMIVSYHRSLLATRCKDNQKRNGAMLAVAVGEIEANSYISRLSAGHVVVACCNSPSSTTVSGDEEAIVELQNTLESFAISARRLNVDTAYHSHHMQAVAKEYLHCIEKLEHGSIKPGVTFYSSVTAEVKDANFGPSYWVQNLVSKVRFSDALQEMFRGMVDEAVSKSLCLSVVEIGPHSTLIRPVKQTITHLKLQQVQYNCISLLNRDRDSQLTFLQSIGGLFARGYPIYLEGVNSLDGMKQKRNVVTNLPPYPFDHSESHWYESRVNRQHRLRPQPYHDLLGLRLLGDTSIEPTWRHQISVESLPWLQDHAVDGRMVLPASGYIAMAIEAKRQITLERFPDAFKRSQKYVLRDLKFLKVLEVPESSDIEMYTTLRYPVTDSNENATNWQELRISSVTLEGVVVEHCCGFVKLESASRGGILKIPSGFEEGCEDEVQKRRLGTIQDTGYPNFNPISIYSEMKSNGHFWGPNFAMIKEFRAGDHDATGTVTIPNVAQSMPGKFMQPHVVHPATLDALIHTSLMIFGKTYGKSVMFPIAIGHLSISGDLVNSPGEELRFATTIAPHGPSDVSIEVSAFQSRRSVDSQLCIHIRDGEIRGTADSQAISASTYADTCYRMEWGTDVSVCIPSANTINPRGDVTTKEKLEILNTTALHFVGACLSTVIDSDVEKQHLEYFAWMQESQDLCRTKRTQSTIEKSIRLSQKMGIEGDILLRVGSHLRSIVTGQCDSLALLFEDDLMTRFYAQDVSSVRCYASLIKYIKQLLFKKPGIKVLEIGAGTGGATLPLLQAVCNDDDAPIEQYDFTDISSGFFDKARLRLQNWTSILRFKTLDIGKDPESQGFTPSSYDVVIAYNAMHAPESVDDALANTRRLLKPNGKLILIEITRLFPYVNTIFGVLPGWYLARRDGRKGPPILSAEEWDSRLRHQSFTGVDIVVDDTDEPANQMSLMISRPESNHSYRRSICLVTDPNSNKSHLALSREFGQHLQNQSCQIIFEGLPLRKPSEDAIYVVFDSDDHPVLMSSSPTVIRGATNLISKFRRVLWISISHGAGVKASTYGSATQLARAFSVTHQYLNLVTLDVHCFHDIADLGLKVFEIMYASFCAPTPGISKEKEYVYNESIVLIPRLRPSEDIKRWLQNAATEPFKLPYVRTTQRAPIMHGEPIEMPKNLLVSGRETESLGPCQIEIEVRAWRVHPLIDKSAEPSHAIRECAGFVVGVGSDVQDRYHQGDPVCGWSRGALYTYTRLNAKNSHHLPGSIHFSIGAALQSSFASAYYGLIDLANLRAGQTVLIHGAIELTGQAAIQIAQRVRARIIATSGAQRQVLTKTYALSENCVISDRVSDFPSKVNHLTEGRGVDVVLNCSPVNMLENSYACIAHFGRYIELRKPNLLGSTRNEESLKKNVLWASVDFPALCEHQPQKLDVCMKEAMLMLDNLKLLPDHHATNMDDLAAVAGLKGRKHLDQVETFSIEVPEKSLDNGLSNELSRTILSSNNTYIIDGNLGRLGLDLCQFLATRGARYVGILSWRVRDPEQQRVFEHELQRLGINVRVISFEPSMEDFETDSMTRQLCDWPVVKGIFQADMLPQKQTVGLAAMEELLKELRSQLKSTRYFLSLEPEFFLTLSSSENFIRNENYPLGRYSAGLTAPNPRTKFLTLCIGPVKGFDLMSRVSPIKGFNDRIDMTAIKNTEVYALLDYMVGGQADKDGVAELVTGFNRRSFASSGCNQGPENPLLSHILRSYEPPVGQTGHVSSEIVEKSLADAKSQAEAFKIVTTAVQRKISSFVAIDDDMIDLHNVIEDFGLDSLVIFRFRNWIFQNFRAALDPPEISDAANIVALAGKILDRTSFKAFRQVIDGGSEPDKVTQSAVSQPQYTFDNLGNFPRQPLPTLEDSLQSFLNSAQPFCSEEEFKCVRQAVVKFKTPDGTGRQLHDRLTERERDPDVENWLADLYLVRRYLRLRKPLVAHQSYFGTHPLGGVSYGSAERAAVVSLAVFDFKQTLESGSLETQYLSGQAIDPNSYHWLFNACREPHLGEDRLCKYPSNDYIVVLRHGKVFKVNLKIDTEQISFRALKHTFEEILSTSTGEISWISLLTLDERDTWAKFRTNLLGSSDTNRLSIQTIEAAAFVVCLDDAQPRNSDERFRQFLLGDGSNRWYDKTLQIIVSGNGFSASLCEHSAIDGISIEPLHDFINRAVREFYPSSRSSGVDHDDLPAVNLRCLPLSSNAAIEDYIPQLRQSFQVSTRPFSFAHLSMSDFGNDFFLAQKCPVQSGIQLAIQLAARKFFKYNPPALETVSMAHFLKGRVEVNHIIQGPMADFLATAAQTDLNTPYNRTELRTLAYKAARSHATSLGRTSKGRGFSRHLLAMEWMLHEEEMMPELFSNPVYQRMKPGKVLTSAFRTGWVEGGFVYPVPESVLVYFEVLNESVSFSIFGNDLDAKDFQNKLARATEQIKLLLNESKS